MLYFVHLFLKHGALNMFIFFGFVNIMLLIPANFCPVFIARVARLDLYVFGFYMLLSDLSIYFSFDPRKIS